MTKDEEQELTEERLKELSEMPISPFVPQQFAMVPKTTRVTPAEVHSMARELLQLRKQVERVSRLWRLHEQ